MSERLWKRHWNGSGWYLGSIINCLIKGLCNFCPYLHSYTLCTLKLPLSTQRSSYVWRYNVNYHHLQWRTKYECIRKSTNLAKIWRKTASREWLSRGQLKCDGTRWRTGEEVKGKLASWVDSQYCPHYLGKWCIHVGKWRSRSMHS